MSRSLYGRKDRLIKEKRHDAYREDAKWPEPTVCTRCGAVFAGGRWTWQEAPAAANEVICPACRRIIDRYPAGTVEIEGLFFEDHYDEILNLIRNVAKQEQGGRPLERIMAITEEKHPTMVTTTGIHLARRIGEALSRAYKGELSLQYLDGEQRIKVRWQR
jgi:NMD protein affecting ribosome stability and mRNA decay